MARKTLGIVALCGLTWLCGDVRSASAQSLFDPFGCCNPCCPAPVVSQACVVPQYTQVPVTTMQDVKRTVYKPVQETRYVDQTVTEMRPQEEIHTVQVPTVQYQTVTENQTRMRDAGRWVTNYQTRPQMTACQYDSRPGMFGWLNRSGFQVRQAFTPKVVASRSYVPNMMAEVVPVTRQVAVQSVQEQQVKVTKMIPFTTTRKVAMTTTKMVAQTETVKQAVTTMQTVPTATAYGFNSFGGTATAVAPTPVTSQKTEAIQQRKALTAERLDEFAPTKDKTSAKETDGKSGSIPNPGQKARESQNPEPTYAGEEPVLSQKTPTAAKVGMWVAARKTTPATEEAEVTVADAKKYTRTK
ncbi:MAG: hypothetical protein U0903_04490 [Planctomycetales bacterium]